MRLIRKRRKASIIIVISLMVLNNQVNSKGSQLGLGFGYETISGLVNLQQDNLFGRVSLSKDVYSLEGFQGHPLSVGFELAVRTGFYGALNITDYEQDKIGGPTPIASSSPRIELLATGRQYLNADRVFSLAKFGVDFSMIKFDRCDLASSTAVNLLGYVGVGMDLTKKSTIQVAISGSSPMSELNFPVSSHIIMNTPYSQVAVLLNWTKVF